MALRIIRFKVPDPIQIGYVLRRMRDEEQMSGSELSKASGVPLGRLYEWERGITTPRIQTVIPLIEAAGHFLCIAKEVPDE